jgi:hypothetical protein
MYITISGTMCRANDVVCRGIDMAFVHAPQLPGAMLWFALLGRKVLLYVKYAILNLAIRFGGNTLAGPATAAFKYAI